MAAYFRLYALTPLSIFIIISLRVGSYAAVGEISCGGMMGTLLTLPLHIFTPAIIAPHEKYFRKLLKRTMLLSTLFLLPCLLLIRLLPLLPSSTIHCTLGLSHININSEDIPACSPCFFNHTANSNITSSKNISAQNFAGSGKKSNQELLQI